VTRTTDPDTAPAQQVRAAAHPTCFVCAPSRPPGLPAGLGLTFAPDPAGDGAVEAPFACDAAFEGYPGVIHGGIVAALLDGAMTNCLFAQGVVALTGDLRVRYRHPLRVGLEARVRAGVTRVTPPLYACAAEIHQAGRCVATATAKFMRAK